MRRKKSPSIDSSSTRSERLRTQSKDELVALLDELAAKHPEVEARLARHALAADPAALASTRWSTPTSTARVKRC